MNNPILPDRQERIRRLDYDYAAQPKQAVVQCNLCGGERLVHVTHTDRYGYAAGASACSACGLVFLNPVMTRAAYARFYDYVYRPLVSAYHDRLIDARSIQDEQKVYARELIAFLEPMLSGRAGRSLLDIGGSTGVVALELARAFELKATVLDPAAAELEWAECANVEVIPGFLEDYDPAGRQFEVITLCQTVDHLTDALGSLKKIRRLLRSDGWFFVDIVDFRAAYLRNESVEAAVKIDHPFYFTEESCAAMLARAGLSPRQVNYAADHLHVGYACAPGEPQPEAIPDPRQVVEFFRELRFIQNKKG